LVTSANERITRVFGAHTFVSSPGYKSAPSLQLYECGCPNSKKSTTETG
jgi:hypothetical protein